jgi:hypothetical protein
MKEAQEFLFDPLARARRYLQEFPPPPAQQLDDVLARADVAENSVESRERRLVQPMRLAGQRVLDHDDVVVELLCVARPRFAAGSIIIPSVSHENSCRYLSFSAFISARN